MKATRDGLCADGNEPVATWEFIKESGVRGGPRPPLLPARFQALASGLNALRRRFPGRGSLLPVHAIHSSRSVFVGRGRGVPRCDGGADDPLSGGSVKRGV